MRWKKPLIIAAMVVVALITTAYVILVNMDFNRYKPQVEQLVFDATGRKLAIEGSLDIGLGVRPTLVAENVSLENASWGSQPYLARVKRLEAQLAVLPLIWGKFDFADLVLVEPEVIVEFDSAGTINFAFETPPAQEKVSKISPPPLIFSDILIEKGLFTYRDAQSDIQFSIRIDHLEGEIDGFDKPLSLDFKGSFNKIPLALEGTLGPIWAWVEPGYSLPANLKVTSSGATATIIGELRNPKNLKDLAFDIAARGSSVAAITKLVGFSDVPELGAFTVSARVSDSTGNLEVEKLEIEIGSRELVAITLSGRLRDVLAQKGVDLKFAATGQDIAHLTQLGLPAALERGAFQITAQISDPEANVYAASDLRVVLEDKEVKGQAHLNLAEKIPSLSARLGSPNMGIGPFNLDFKMTGPVGKLTVTKFDLKLGRSDLAEIRLNGVVDDLMRLQGVNINLQASGKDLANLRQLTGQPLPVRGAFNATGKVIVPVHMHFKIPDLKMMIGKNNISGFLNLDLRGERPQLETSLSSPGLNLPSVLLPELASQGWAGGLGLIRPVKLTAKLAGFTQEVAVESIDLQAGTLDTAAVQLTGSVENVPARRGIDLNFTVQGNDLAKLNEIMAQPYLFIPVEGQGAYTISGHFGDPQINEYVVSDLKFVVADTELNGRLSFNLAAQPAWYDVDLSSRQFNLKPFPLPKKPVFTRLSKLDDLGTLKIRSKVLVERDHFTVQQLSVTAGMDQLAVIEINGSIQNLARRSGLDLNFNMRGDDIATLSRITGQSIPLQGLYVISGRLTDPAKNNYKLNELSLKLGENNITGSVDLDLSGKQLRLATDLSAPQFNLQPVVIPALDSLSRIQDLGPLKLAFNLDGVGSTYALDNLDLSLGHEDLVNVRLKGTISNLPAVQGMKLDFSARGNNISNIEKIGGPAIPFQGAFNVSGRVIDSAPKVYKISSFNAALGDNKQSGWLALAFSGKRPQINAELSSQKLDLRPLFEKPDAKSPTGTQISKPAPRKDQYFSSKPFELEGLKVIDADIKLRNKQVLLPALALDDVILDILLDNGNFKVKPFSFTVGGGAADVQMELRLLDNPPTLAVAKVVDQLDVGLMLDKLGYRRSIEGMLDTEINLTGRGASVAELMAGLNGSVSITMVDGQASARHLETLQRYLGSNVLQLLNPFQAQREFAPINCFVNTIQIIDGLADVKLLLDTDQTSIFGIGDVNLRTEKLDLGIKPTPKKGHGISGVGSVSFSLKELSQPFRLGGTLANPSLVVDPGRTAFVVGKLAGALALGPVGIAAFFGDVSVGKKDPCALALEAASKVESSADGEKGKQQSKQKDTGSEKEKKSGGFFKRIFGK